MTDDLEAFLRQAAQRRKQPQQQQPSPPQPAPALRPVQPRDPDIVIYDAEVADEPLTEHVSESVTAHLDTHEFAERAAHLGEEVGYADEKMDAHMEQVFDHRLGNLGDKSITDVAFNEPKAGDDPYAEEAPKKRKTTAKKLAQMFRSPQNIVQGFIFSEIMRPPHDRW